MSDTSGTGLRDRLPGPLRRADPAVLIAFGCILLLLLVGSLYSPNDYGAAAVLLGGAQDVPVTFPESPGHFEEWVNAIRGGPASMANFPDYASPLTETVLLGNVALRFPGQRLLWDSANMKITNDPKANAFLRREYRKGWEVA